MNYKALLKSYGLSPRKRFSQNFLLDKQIAGRIVGLLELSSDDHVIEIGPGLGILTEWLLDTGAKVISVEIDRELAGILQHRFFDRDNLEVINQDALKVSYAQLVGRYGGRVKLVSNLPYNISTPMIFKLLEEREAFSTLVLMLQKEVAQRIASPPGVKDYGILSIFVQLLADVKIEFDVSPSCFYPKPTVYSSVVRFSPLPGPRVNVRDLDVFKRVVKVAFSQRRKTILNNLKALKLSTSELKHRLESSGIDPGRRGETLNLEEFAMLSNELREAIFISS